MPHHLSNCILRNSSSKMLAKSKDLRKIRKIKSNIDLKFTKKQISKSVFKRTRMELGEIILLL